MYGIDIETSFSLVGNLHNAYRQSFHFVTDDPYGLLVVKSLAVACSSETFYIVRGEHGFAVSK